VKLPALSLAKTTVPPGVVGEEFVSVTVAVHVDGLFTLTEAGVQDREVVVRSPGLTVRVRVELVLLRAPEVALMIAW